MNDDQRTIEVAAVAMYNAKQTEERSRYEAKHTEHKPRLDWKHAPESLKEMYRANARREIERAKQRHAHLNPINGLPAESPTSLSLVEQRLDAATSLLRTISDELRVNGMLSVQTCQQINLILAIAEK